MYLPYLSRVKDQGRTKDEPRNDQRTPNQEMCVLLRLPSLFPLLYLASFSERTPTQLRLNSLPLKVLFLNIAFLKRLTHFLKALPYIPRLYTLHSTPYTRKITSKSDFSCTSQKKSVSLQPNELKSDVYT